MYILRFDGMLQTARREPFSVSLLGYGWILERNGLERVRGFGLFLGHPQVGSNIAEYLALLQGLESLLELRLGGEPIEVRGDAKCVIDQMMGDAAVNSPGMVPLHRRARRLSRHFPHLSWVWVPRRENLHADRLSRRSFQYLRSSPHWDRELRHSRLASSRQGRWIPVVDMRVHVPGARAGMPAPLQQ